MDSVNNLNNKFSLGQRVRINEEKDPAVHVGKMGIIENIETTDENDAKCMVRLDRTKELISFPPHYLEAIVTKPCSVLANDLFLPWDMDSPRLRFREFTLDRWIVGRVMESLLYYDRIVIPTVDYSVIVPLVHWIGPALMKEMLESEAISFVRYTGGLAYLGNGNGLGMFELLPGKKPDNWWLKAPRCSSHEAVELQLQNRVRGLKEGIIDFLGKMVEICTVDTALPQFQQKVAEETYRDILGSDILRLWFSIRNTNLTRLTGLRNDQMRVFSRLGKPAVNTDEIDITLRLAMLNLETYLAEEAGVRDMVTDHGFGLLLRAKVNRYTSSSVAEDSFSRLVEIENLPDVVTILKEGQVDLSKVWEFRNTKKAIEFRQWFDQTGPSDTVKLTQEYVKMLRSENLLSSGKAKLMKFIVVQAIGAVLTPVTQGYSLIASLGLSAVDSFLLDRIRLGYNPRYFIDEIKHRFFRDVKK